MKRYLVLAALVALPLAACSSTHPGNGVPSLAGGTASANGTSSQSPGASKSEQSRPRVGYSTTRVAQLHTAAQCIREHGVPSYQDPVLTGDGHVYTDARSIQDIGRNDRAGTAGRHTECDTASVWRTVYRGRAATRRRVARPASARPGRRARRAVPALQRPARLPRPD